MTAFLSILLIVYLTFVHYSAVMNLQRVRNEGKLTLAQKPWAYVTLLVGLVLDVALNLIACFFILLVLPRDWLLTGTLIRYKRAGEGWRFKISSWLCSELLDTLDPHPSGCHCRTD